MKKTAVVAMSGGVDSSVAALLLKEKGYDVIGATMQMWKEGKDRSLRAPCRSSQLDDARRVAQQIGIPFYVFNLEEEFEKEVIQYFCEEYGNGRTPNPCVVCNEKVKFGALLEKAWDLGANYVSTGHYVRLGYDEEMGRYLLRKGRDRKKDQSYVLFPLTQDQLSRVLFPLGDFRKEEVRQKALQFGLCVHDKPESQEVCFTGRDSYHPFLVERLKGSFAPGPIVDRAGNLMGTHQGIPFYTIGQRRGLRLAKGVPLYVIGIDRKRNAVIVGEEEEVLGDTCIVDCVHWIIPPPDCCSLTANVKIRYNHAGSRATVSLIEGDQVRVEFHRPQKAITPGQAAVFYDGDIVLGGGWIDRTARPGMKSSE